MTFRIICFVEHNKNYNGNQYSDLSLFKSIYFFLEYCFFWEQSPSLDNED